MFFNAIPAKATQPEVTFCHCEQPQEGQETFQCQTLTTSEEGYENGHSQHENDYLGECEEEPSVTPTPSPTPTEEPCEYECEPTVTPTPTPEPTEEPREPQLCEDSTALNYNEEASCRYPGPASAPQGPSCVAPVWAPTVTFTGRVDEDTVTFSWTKVADNVNQYVVWYGTSEDNLPWNTIVSGESVELNEVPNSHIWAKVQANDNGCLGPFSATVDP